MVQELVYGILFAQVDKAEVFIQVYQVKFAKKLKVGTGYDLAIFLSFLQQC